MKYPQNCLNMAEKLWNVDINKIYLYQVPFSPMSPILRLLIEREIDDVIIVLTV